MRPGNVDIITVIIACSYAFCFVQCLHVQGSWNSGAERIRIITKFGIQQTSSLRKELTRGYIFGNVTTSSRYDTKDGLIFALVRDSLSKSLHSDSYYGSSCASIMQNLSRVGFETRCFNNGSRDDIFRRIPCLKNELCSDEDNPKNVFSGYQLTMRIEEPTVAEYWNVALIACDLDEKCEWVASKAAITVDYDLWLTNGIPSSNNLLFSVQFSFDEQNTAEIYTLTLVAYSLLCIATLRAKSLCKVFNIPPKLNILSYIIYLKTFGVALQTLNILVFAIDGEGIIFARTLGELLRLASIDLLCFLLILLARGWSFSPSTNAISPCFIIAGAFFSIVHLVLFVFNVTIASDTVRDIDVFSSWPGFGVLAIRIAFTLWFLFEIRAQILREHSQDRAVFLANIGAGFLVFLIYPLGFGVVTSFISQLWRFKVILAITSLANITAISCVLHLFWPTGSYRKYFQDDLNGHRRMNRTDSHEMQDFERLLFESSDSDVDYPEAELPNNLHSI